MEYLKVFRIDVTIDSNKASDRKTFSLIDHDNINEVLSKFVAYLKEYFPDRFENVISLDGYETIKNELQNKLLTALKDIPHLAIDYNMGLRDDVDGDYLEEEKVLEVISNIFGAAH